MNEANDTKLSVFRISFLVLCVAAAGMAVMIYEMMVIRFLARYFGGAIDIWAFEIAVCLAGLTLGYYVGGILADRFHSWRVMGLAFIIGGISGLCMELLADQSWAILKDITFALRWHPFIAAGISSFIPMLALGTVLPQSIRLIVRRLDRVGSSAGRLSAVSSFGSIAGVLLAVLVFMPHIGVRQSIVLTSIILMVLGVLLIVLPRPQAIAAILAVGLFYNSTSPAHAQIIYEDYSMYHHILVEDRNGTRVLRFDAAEQSHMSLENPYSGGFEYTDFFHAPILLDPTITDALFIGLGGGTGPKSFLASYPQMKIAVVEIDPMVITIAHEYFAVPKDSRLNIVAMDGRTYLQRGTGAFGAIIVDAYASGPYGPFIPYHLATTEFFNLVSQRLINGGSLVYNVIGVFGGENDETVRAIQATLESIFPVVYAFQAKSSWNTVFVAQKIDYTALHSDGTRDGYAWPQGPWLQHPIGAAEFRQLAQHLANLNVLLPAEFDSRITQFSAAQSARRTGQILTDNFAPVDLSK